MYCLSNLCCICLHNIKKLIKLSTVDKEQVSFYEKLICSIPEMNSKDLNKSKLICIDCCNILNIIYKFRNICLRSKSVLQQYIHQLQEVGGVQGVATVVLVNIKNVKEEVKAEKEPNNTIINAPKEAEVQSNFNDDVQYVVNDPESIQLTDLCYDLVIKPETVKMEADNDYNDDNISFLSLDVLNAELDPEQQQMEDDRESFTPLNNYLDYDDLEIIYEGNLEHHDEMPKEILEHEKRDKRIESTESNELAKKERKRNKWQEIFEQNQKILRSTGFFKSVQTRTAKKAAYECEICKKKFPTPNSLHNHSKEHISERKYVCNKCHLTFLLLKDLNEHKKLHLPRKKIYCKICKRHFSTLQKLLNHRKIHIGYNCEICKRNFTRRCHLTNHRRTHTGAKKYWCRFCNRGFFKLSDLCKHSLVHPESDAQFKEETPKKISVNVSPPKITVEKTYGCKLCSRQFSTQGALMTHMRIHTKIPPVCDICKKKFASFANLRRHKEQVHGLEEVHECKICKKKFAHKYYLLYHIQTHGEKCFKCDICNKTFMHLQNLRRHKKNHVIGEQHQCNVCAKIFVRAGYLASHMRKHFQDKLYTCLLCNETFTDARTLNKHRKNHDQNM